MNQPREARTQQFASHSNTLAEVALPTAIGQLNLKDMDAALLISDIRGRAAAAGMSLTAIDSAVAIAAFAH